MTAKEKAIEIFNFYLDATDLNQTIAKACSVFCVDQIITAVDNAADLWHHANEYWQEVKQELEKL